MKYFGLQKASDLDDVRAGAATHGFLNTADNGRLAVKC
jgi:hypothetical protein